MSLLSFWWNKNYFLAAANGYPSMDYAAFIAALREKMPYADWSLSRSGNWSSDQSSNAVMNLPERMLLALTAGNCARCRRSLVDSSASGSRRLQTEKPNRKTAGGQAAKLDYPMHADSLDYAASRFTWIYENLLKDAVWWSR